MIVVIFIKIAVGHYESGFRGLSMWAYPGNMPWFSHTKQALGGGVTDDSFSFFSAAGFKPLAVSNL
jgi:hypothetical protein